MWSTALSGHHTSQRRATPSFALRLHASFNSVSAAARMHTIFVGLLLGLMVPDGVTRAQQDYSTIVVLGAAWPLETRQGLATQFVIAKHTAADFPGNATLKLSLESTKVSAGMVHGIGAGWELGYRYRLEWLSAGMGMDLYTDGTRQLRVGFEADAHSVIGELGWQFAPQRRLSLEVERRETQPRLAPQTRDGFDLPPLFHTLEARLLYSSEQGIFGQEPILTIEATSGQRDGWRDWGLDEDSKADRYTRWFAEWKLPLVWNEAHRSTVQLQVGGGEHLDLFNDLRSGGFVGEIPVAGWYRNEFRAKRMAGAHAQQQWSWAEDRRLTLLADTALVEELTLNPAAPPPDQRTIAGIGLALYWGIRGLMGVPIILRYGEALNVPKDMGENHRREFMLVMAAAF